MDKCKKTLGLCDLIEMGENTGETVETCVKRFGKKSLLNVLKYYNLSEDVQMMYHFHLNQHQENPNLVENKVQVSKTDPVEEFVTTTTLDEEYLDQEEMDFENDYWNTPVLYDPEDDDEFADPLYKDSYKPWIYGR